MRLFVALHVAPEIRQRISDLVRELRAADARPKWVKPDNLHLTLKFLGQVAPDTLPRVVAALATVPARPAIEVRIRRLGFFPAEKHATVFWVGVEPGAGLTELASQIDLRMRELGFAPEQRAFQPHLTLARFNPPGASQVLQAAFHHYRDMEFGVLRATDFHLVESKTRPAGAEYTTLQSFPLVAEV